MISATPSPTKIRFRCATNDGSHAIIRNVTRGQPEHDVREKRHAEHPKEYAQQFRTRCRHGSRESGTP